MERLATIENFLQEFEDLKRRVYTLEEEKAVKEFMSEFALKIDYEFFAKSDSSARILAENYLTPNGVFESLWDKYGPDKQEIIDKHLNFARDPDGQNRLDAKGVDWSIHLFLHQEVSFSRDENEIETANFKAREIVPIMWNGQAKWLFADNDSILKKIEVGNGKKEWRMEKYRIKGINVLGNAETAWPGLTAGEEGCFFNPEIICSKDIDQFIRRTSL